ncbi:MAG: hypothetical protein RLZZ618_2734 [Pseudomonadota bacterium]|jgi:MFS family permease
MSSPIVRTVLPLALITSTSMLAMDLFLPAVPGLQTALGTSVTLAQATIAVFLAGLAASQLVWGEAMSRFGPRRCVFAGALLLCFAGAGCALSPDIHWLLAMRALQGAAAGAATVVAPSVVRATLHDTDAMRGIATLSMVESLVPAGGPVLGAALLLVMDWRGTFWMLAAVTLVVLPFVVRVTPLQLPGLDRRVASGYGAILSNRRYLRVGLSHALCFAALITFVASGPQLVLRAYGLGPSAFALLQVLSVSTFLLVASQAGRIGRHLGARRAIHLGAVGHVVVCGLLGVWALAAAVPFAALAVFWCGFCGVLALRGPAAFSEALSLPPSQMGRATAMFTLALLLAGAVGTLAVAPFLTGSSVVPLAVTMLVLCALSAALVMPYPEAPSPGAKTRAGAD